LVESQAEHEEGLILILTGGLSTRMGRAKALLPVAAGAQTTFLARLVGLTEGLSGNRAVVSSLPPEELGVALPVVGQPHPERGQLDSMLLGWDAHGKRLPWVMSCPVDHPFVTRSTLESLIQATRTHPQAQMWSPSYQGRGGHPVIFSSELISQLREHRTEGARAVVQGLGARRHRVESQDEGILGDIDTPEDYQAWSRRFT
jgi:molybdenum cofactor cytidylyltransferase